MVVFSPHRLALSLVVLVLILGCGQPRPPAAPPRTTSVADRASSPPAIARVASEPAPSSATAPIRFVDATEAARIGFVHTDGSSGRRYLVEPLSAGVATFDYDGDGRIDLYLPNGAALPGAEPGDSESPPRHALCRNLGAGVFRDVSLAAGIDCRDYGLGVVAGDVDEDGFADLFLTTFGAKRLFRNLGDGS
ncbi:MAG: hypothetical protein RLZZ326_1862, partial [Planctomycetota bacterium]